MEAYDQLVAAIDGLEGLTDEQKTALKSPAGELNKQLGIRGSDLIKVKSERDTVSNQVKTYKEFADTMAKFNMSAEDVKKAADAAGIQQTQDDTVNELKDILSKTQKELDAARGEINLSKMEKLITPKIDEAVKNYKDSEGKGFDFLKDFVDVVSKELFQGIKENDDEVIINDRISTALNKAKVDQENFMQRNNLAKVDTGIHRVEERVGAGSGSGSGIKAQELQKILVDGGGTVDAAARAMAAARNAQQ